MEQQDELIGFWRNDPDDSSGLHGIWGYGVEFLPGGEGSSVGWHGSHPEENYEHKFIWQRVSDEVIKMKYEDEVDDDWETIEYEAKDLTRLYGWHSLIEKGKDGFLGSVGALGRFPK